ncbi:MAG: MBL fold metallo-hydrolase, partial [Chloroflexota bacterium]
LGGGDLLAEWGLSILVETDGATVLLDAGRSLSVVNNTDVLGIDLDKIDKIVLSHGHFDHTGGLYGLLRKMKRPVEIIAHPDVWAAKYSRRPGKADRYTGIPFRRQALENLGAVFNLTREPVRITDNIITTGEVPRVTDFEPLGGYQFVREGDEWRPDELRDDQAIIIKTGLGLVVVLGCAHRGVINTLYHARQLTGVKTIHTVVGGAHLVDAPEDRIQATIAALNDLGVARLGLCHCTSLPAITRLAAALGDRFCYNTTGTVLTVPEEG